MIEIFQKANYYLVVNRSNLKWILGTEDLKKIASNLQKEENLSPKEYALKQYLESPSMQHQPDWCLDNIKSIALMPTLGCNLKCIHCFYSSSPKEKAQWKPHVLEDVKRLLTQMDLPGGVTLTGGEPFQYKDVKELISFILNNTNLRLNIMTNGVHIPLKELEGWHKDHLSRLHIQVSLDGVSNSCYQKVRGVRVDSALNSIRSLRDMGANLTLSFTLNKLIEEDFFKFIAFAESVDATMHFPFLEDFGRAAENSLEISPNHHQLMKFLIYYKLHVNPQAKISFVDGLINAVKNKSLASHCQAAHGQIAIFPNGEIFPCSELNLNDFQIGNICDYHDLSQLEEDIRKFRSNSGFGQDVSEKICTDCAFAYLCSGNCRAEEILSHKDFFSPHSALRCAFLRDIYELAIWEVALSQSQIPNYVDLIYESKIRDYVDEIKTTTN